MDIDTLTKLAIIRKKKETNMVQRFYYPPCQGFWGVWAVSLIDVMRREYWGYSAYLDSELVLGANGIVVKGDVSIDEVEADEFDMIVLPGGWEGTYNLADDERVQNLLREFNAKEKLVGAICAAPFALNRAGVLKRWYTCYPSVEDEI